MIKKCIGTLVALMLATASAVTGYAESTEGVQLDFYTDGVNVIVNGTPTINSVEITLEFASTVKNPTIKWASQPANTYTSYQQDGNKLTLYIDSPSAAISQNGTTKAALIRYNQYKNTDAVLSATLKTVDRDLIATDYHAVAITQNKYNYSMNGSSGGGDYDEPDEDKKPPAQSSSQPQEVPPTSSAVVKPEQPSPVGKPEQPAEPTQPGQPEESEQPEQAGAIVNTEDSAIYTLKKGETVIPFDVMHVLYEQNKTKLVELRGDGYEMRFAVGSMQMPYQGEAFDTGVRIDTPSAHKYPIGEEEHLVAAVVFAHSGPLPGKAEITLELGSEQANKALRYSYFDQEQNQLTETQFVTVGADGSITVVQEHCSTYLVTESLDQANAQQPAAEKKSMLPIALVIITAAVVALLAYFLKASSRKRES